MYPFSRVNAKVYKIFKIHSHITKLLSPMLNFFFFQRSKYDLFARKFEAIVNQKVINLLEEYLYGKIPPETPGLSTYWENFYHHLDDDHRLSDTLRTFFTSFSRLASKYVSSMHCKNLPVGQFKEITYLNEEDEFSGMLVLQDVSLKGGRGIEIETWLSRVDHEQMMNLNMSDGPNRLAGLQVSFDKTFSPYFCGRILLTV